MKSFSLGVIGDPIAHTLSPLLHETIAAQLTLSCTYLPYHVRAEELSDFARSARESLDGFNVTIPHKQAIIPLLDEIDESAAACQAVNTVCVRDGRLIGYNTDGDGFLAALKQDCALSPEGLRVLMIGAGGAAKAIHYALRAHGAKQITVACRDPKRAEAFALSDVMTVVPMTPEQLRLSARDADLIVNTTPLGMQGYAADFTDCSFLDDTKAAVYDIVYRPTPTTLVKEAARRSLRCANGFGMLIHQAVIAFSHFTGAQFDAQALAKAVDEAVGDRRNG